jgi:hypothetical protein
LAITLIRYGSESVITAAASHATESAIGRLLTFGPSWIGTLDFVLPLGLVGMAIVAHRREWLLPVWVSLMLVVPGGEGRYAAVAWAMLAATGAVLIGQRMAADGALKLAAGVGSFLPPSARDISPSARSRVGCGKPWSLPDVTCRRQRDSPSSPTVAAWSTPCWIGFRRCQAD